MKLNEEQFEKLLQELPKFERNAQAEAKFFKKLDALAEQREKVAPTLASLGRRVNEVASLRLGLWFAWPRLAFVGSFAALILIVGGTFAAYQPSVTRGSFLYPWKQAGERVELAFAATPLQKVDTHVRFSDRRMSEAENIVARNPSLAWIVPKAAAHEGEIHLDSEEAVYLAETLADMRREVSLAAEVIETKISLPEQAEAALEKIEKAAERHVEALAEIEEKASKEVKAIVGKIADEEDEHLAVFVEAKEKVKAAKVRNEAAVAVKLMELFEQREKFAKREEKREDRKQEARDEFVEAVRMFQKLSPDQKKQLEEQLERAKEAFEEGKFGRTKGLSRALQNELKETPVEREKVPDPGFKPPEPQNENDVPDPGFKPEPDEIENIYNDPKLSPPKPNDPAEDEMENPDEFLMEIEKVKDSEGIFDENQKHERTPPADKEDKELIRKMMEKMPPEMEFRMREEMERRGERSPTEIIDAF